MVFLSPGFPLVASVPRYFLSFSALSVKVALFLWISQLAVPSNVDHKCFKTHACSGRVHTVIP
jgi:hypothetical protein